MDKLFSMSKLLYRNNINVILIQIDEAHSTAWPMAIDTLLNVDKVEPQKTFEDRINRANYFVEKYNPPYPVYIDNWSNEFANLFMAWPDKYHFINKDLVILAKSEYFSEGKKEAVIMEDYTVLLEKYIK